MDYVNLPDLRGIMRGFSLRVDAARAISHVETAAMNGVDVSEMANTLGGFFSACANAVYSAAGGEAPSPE